MTASSSGGSASVSPVLSLQAQDRTQLSDRARADDRWAVIAERPQENGNACLAGGGEMGARMRSMDWSTTPVGPVERWPHSLKTAANICLGSRHPMVIWWGNPAFTQFYNDAYISFLGTAKHPRALGQSARDCWSEIWSTIEPMVESVYRSGEATWSEDLLFVINRRLPREEGYFTFSYSPIRDDDGSIGGIFCACNETTARVVGERRLRTLGDLNRVVAEAKTAEASCEVAARTLGENPGDIPFALIYLLHNGAEHARLIATTSVKPETAAAPSSIDLKEEPSSTWPLRRVLEAGTAELVQGLTERFGALPGGLWPESPEAALIVPIAAPGQARATGFLVCGLSPRRVVDADYRSFLELVASHIGTAVANARAHEEERRRAEALAELDRAKTTFFSNVSHEFRTPLTLMLGPLEEVLAAPAAHLTHRREDLALVHRNGLRLLRLVNTLLDFSRIEAGRVQASYEPVELAKLTSELASVFRAAIEAAGLRLIVECPPLSEAVWVDRDMWEKITLNLISNAFKFTFTGHIAVRLSEENSIAVLTIEDTGTGIPPHELPRLFDLFHRLEGARGRTHEGTGIGLALVQELVKLHGGTVRVESTLGAGSNFTVAIPLGTAHLPADRLKAERSLVSTALGTQPYVEEVMRWIPGAATPVAEDVIERELLTEPMRIEPGLRATVLLADDNADMRDYVRRLLGPHYEVETASDGLQALAAVRDRRPDLLLSDVMMPGLDGLGLVREIRSDADLADLPIILLSARAGEEASLEGLAAGADDYLVKPFSARELVARIVANLKMAKLRQSFNERMALDLKAMTRLIEIGNLCMRGGRSRTACFAEILDAAIEITGAAKGNVQLLDAHNSELSIAVHRGFSKPFLDFFASVRRGDAAACGNAMQTTARVVVEDVTRSEIFAGQSALDVLLAEGVRAVQSTPVVASSGQVLGIISTHFDRPHRPDERELRLLDLLARQVADYVERQQGEDVLRASEERFRAFAESLPALIFIADAGGNNIYTNPHFHAFLGLPAAALLGAGWLQVIHADDRARAAATWEASWRTGVPYAAEYRFCAASGEYRTHLVRGAAVRDGSGKILQWVGTGIDVQELHRAEAELREAQRIGRIGSWHWDAPTHSDANRSSAELFRIFGLDPSQGMPAFSDQNGYLYPAESWERLNAAVREAMRTGIGYELDLPAKRADDGAPIWITTRGEAVCNADGRVIALRGTVQDISERKHTEAALRELTETLERKVAERTSALADEMAERQQVEETLHQAQRLEAIGQLTGGVAHDFNNILTVVVAQAEAIIASARRDERIGRMAATVLRAAERGAQLTNQLLAFARRQQLRPVTVALQPLIANVSELARRVVGESIIVEFRTEPALSPSRVDPAQFESALLNLAINARDAMPNGGRLTILARNRPVDGGEAPLLDVTPGDYVEISVTDTGVGMTSEVRRRAFEPFFTTKDTGKGTGLGLAQIYGFVRQSGGTALLDSAVGKGTTVTMLFPKSDSPVEEVAGSADPASLVLGHGKTILLVEDQSDVRDVIVMSLESLGFRVLTARDGVIARDVLAGNETIDLLLTDVVMPNGVSGLDLAADARRLRQDIKVVLISGYLRDLHNRQSAAHDWLLLIKPFSHGELVEILAAAISGRGA